MSNDWERASLEISDDGELRARRHGTSGPVVPIGDGAISEFLTVDDDTPGDELLMSSRPLVITSDSPLSTPLTINNNMGPKVFSISDVPNLAAATTVQEVVAALVTLGLASAD